MGIFFIWLGFVCCGVANGLIYDHVQVPQSYCYMLISIIITAVLLVIHSFYTRHWCGAIDEGDEHHPSIFGGSACFSFVAVILSLLAVCMGEASMGLFIAFVSMFVSFYLARMGEEDYD